jgi:hypothetical protein
VEGWGSAVYTAPTHLVAPAPTPTAAPAAPVAAVATTSATAEASCRSRKFRHRSVTPLHRRAAMPPPAHLMHTRGRQTGQACGAGYRPRTLRTREAHLACPRQPWGPVKTDTQGASTTPSDPVRHQPSAYPSAWAGLASLKHMESVCTSMHSQSNTQALPGAARGHQRASGERGPRGPNRREREESDGYHTAISCRPNPEAQER